LKKVKQIERQFSVTLSLRETEQIMKEIVNRLSGFVTTLVVGK